MKNEFKWRGILPLALSACLLTSLVSCGNDDDDSNNDTQAEEQTQDGVFTAVLTPENASVSSASGSAVMTILGDELTAKVRVTGAKVGTHAQHVHAGTRCPTPEDDTNGDGVVDATEASAVYGGVLLALDSDLAGSAGDFPNGMAYSYDESASVAQILSNLGLASLALEGKVVNIHGVPESTSLPATIQGGKAAFPISCGVLTKSSDTSAASSATTDAASAVSSAAASTEAASAATAAATDATAAAAASDASAAAAAASSAVSSASAASTGSSN